MFQELRLIFQANVGVERYEVSNKFYSCKMEENSSISEHIVKMCGYHNHLTQLELIFQMIVLLKEFFNHYHQATKAS